ncbi:MAG: Twin-arginine translocation pathway signal [Betaproteobacteria bacterium]|nr:Twin-arginine translocation pathway signal [Betaproteobacteria bacterium]
MHPVSASRRTFMRRAGLALAAGAAPRAFAAAAPIDQLHVLVGFPAGSIPDLVARLAADNMAEAYPRRVLVDNRPGAAGQIAVGALKAGPADGSMLLLAQGTAASAYPYLYSKLGYDPAADLKPVSLAAEVTLGVAVGPAVPASVGNVRELAEWMRRNPALANIGSPGVGTPPHLLEAMLFRSLDAPWQHIAYPGGPPAVAALLGGQIAAVVLPEGLLRQQQAAGKLRVLATSGARRSAYLPEVATLVEQGYPNLVVSDWFAFFMSSRVSRETIEATSQTLRAALARPQLVTAYADAGMLAAPSTPAALAERISTDAKVWEQVIRANNIHVD